MGLLLGAVSTLVYAASSVPDATGSYSGTLTVNEICNNPSPPPSTVTQTDQVQLTFTITQSGSNITGSGTSLDLRNSKQGTLSFSGTINASGIATGSISDSAGFTGTFTGTLNGDSLDLSVSGGDSSCPTQNGSGIMTRTSGGSGELVVNPETTPSNILTAPLLLSTQVKAVTSNIGTRIGDVLRGIQHPGPRVSSNGLMYENSSGLNAGDRMINYGAWASYSYADYKNDLSSTAFDGHTHTVLAGVDVAPWEKVVIGLSAGYENSDIDTGFNQGNQQSDGYTIAPYFGAVLSDTWSVDFSAGYSSIDYDQFRTAPGTGLRVTSSPNTDRWFGALNVNGLWTYDKWTLGAKIGTLYTKSVQNSFTESDGTKVSETDDRLGQWLIGGNVAYSLGDFEPFASATYERDYSRTVITVLTGPQPANDNDDVLVGAGVRYFGPKGITGNLEWNKRVSRENFDEDVVTATLRLDF
ncbi:MAG TPA: autotransporter outer membrane beta-barrel domain-containing protein [Gammaproteobacteria bacterium]|nr:autotransporter outer membrane beta-barrel domain-containing protein [Gammaproteobacteria bacterium]